MGRPLVEGVQYCAILDGVKFKTGVVAQVFYQLVQVFGVVVFYEDFIGQIFGLG